MKVCKMRLQTRAISTRYSELTEGEKWDYANDMREIIPSVVFLSFIPPICLGFITVAFQYAIPSVVPFIISIPWAAFIWVGTRSYPFYRITNTGDPELHEMENRIIGGALSLVGLFLPTLIHVVIFYS